MTTVNCKPTLKGPTATVEIYVDGVQLIIPAADGSYNIDRDRGNHTVKIRVGSNDGDSASVDVTGPGITKVTVSEDVPVGLHVAWSDEEPFVVP